MKAQQIRTFDMARRVQRFLDESGAALGALRDSDARAELDDIVRQMSEDERAQAHTDLLARSQTAVQARLRKELWRHHMLPVAAIAAAHARDIPGLGVVRMPPFKVKTAGLVEAAIAMAATAREYPELFIANGRPADFVDAMLAAAAAVRASIDARARWIVARAEARAGLKATASRVHLIIRVLDAHMKSALVDDPSALAGWNSAKRIGKGKALKLVEDAVAA